MTDHDPAGEPTRADTPVTDPTLAMPGATGGPPTGGPPPLRPPPDEPGDRRPWIIAGLVALLALVGLVLVVLADDEESASDAPTTAEPPTTTTTTTEATTTSTTEATTTSAAPTTSPPATVAPGLCQSSSPDDPATTAQVVYQAYALGDRDCTANLMTSDALDDLFSIAGGGGGWTFAGCFDEDEPDPHTLCAYTFDGGATDFRMAYSDTEGWTVYEVFQVAD